MGQGVPLAAAAITVFWHTPGARADVVFDGLVVNDAAIMIDATGDPGFGLGYADEWDVAYEAFGPSFASAFHALLEHAPTGFTLCFGDLGSDPGS